MPKILSYTPPWLSRPSPGSKIFSDPRGHVSQTSTSNRTSQLGSPNAVNQGESYQGPRRLLANRGTEIFTVVDNKIRWADLAKVKSDWDEQADAREAHRGAGLTQRQNGASAPYRVGCICQCWSIDDFTDLLQTLTVPVYQKIRQLVISPSNKFLAILTEHTVHIAILPDTSRLNDLDQTPLKLKTYQLGPTTHVIPQSPLVCALWHPLAVSSNLTDCLLTITAEAAVRVWELDRSNQWSFDQPALAIDLKKLIDGTSCDQDFTPSAFGKNRGFSADFFDMEATSACFGGAGQPGEDGWASMTLWVAMRNGDLYALCPLLPSKWRPPVISVAALSTHVVSKMSCIEDGELDPDEEKILRQQFEWVQELDIQEPFLAASDSDPSMVEEVWVRPSNPSVIPKLQGPFNVDLSDDCEDLEVCEIHVVAGKLDFDEIFSGEQVDFADDFERAQDNLAATIICVATTDAVVHVLLDMEGVSGQWLPKARGGTFTVPVSDSRELLLVESLNIDQASQKDTVMEWPMFSYDIASPYNLYLTSSQQISFISLCEWVSRLDLEITSSVPETAGLELRLKTMCEGPVAFLERLLVINETRLDGAPALLSAPVIIRDSELGHMILASTASRAYAMSFDQPEDTSFARSPVLSQNRLLSPIPRNTDLIRASTPSAAEDLTPRDSYKPPSIFYDPPTAPLKDFLSMNVPPRQKLTLKQEIRLSPATLDLMSLAHRAVAAQTSQLEGAAADLFRRCEQLREELSNQVKQMSELSSRIQRLDSGNGDDVHTSRDFESRIESAKERQQKLSDRHEILRRKLARAGTAGRNLSTHEISWAQEITGLAKMVGVEMEEANEDHEERQPVSGNVLDERYRSVSLNGITPDNLYDIFSWQQVKQLAQELLTQAEALRKDPPESDDRTQTNGRRRSLSSASLAGGSVLVPSKLQKAKIMEAIAMVERESAIIEAVMARLESLNVEN
jgi:nucleoporin NUP82